MAVVYVGTVGFDDIPELCEQGRMRGLGTQSLEDIRAIIRVGPCNQHRYLLQVSIQAPSHSSPQKLQISRDSFGLFHHKDATNNTLHATKRDVVEHGVLDLTKELIWISSASFSFWGVGLRHRMLSFSELSPLQMTKRSVENASAMRLTT